GCGPALATIVDRIPSRIPMLPVMRHGRARKRPAGTPHEGTDMKRILFAMALAVVAADARADWGWGAGSGPQPAPAPQAGNGQGAYGWNPVLKRCLWWKKDNGCSNCGAGGKHGAGGYGAGAAAASGTLVFPQHQFARSPRDWFMFGY